MATTFEIDFLVGNTEVDLLAIRQTATDNLKAFGNVVIQSTTTRDLSVTSNAGNAWTPVQTIRACNYALQKLFYNTDQTKYGTDLIRSKKKTVF